MVVVVLPSEHLSHELSFTSVYVFKESRAGSLLRKIEILGARLGINTLMKLPRQIETMLWGIRG